MSQINYRQPVATQEDGTIVVLDYTFVYSPEFVGAVGVEVYPVYPESIREAMSEKRDYLRETADDCGFHGQARQNLYAMGKEEYLEMRYESYRDIPTATLAAAVGIPTPERFTLASIGRIFPRALDGATILPGAAGLVAVINQAENK